MAVNKVLLIGGTGFIGRHLAARLTREGIRVRIATRRRERAKALTVLPGVEVVEANPGDSAALARLLCGVDAVVNHAGVLHDRDGRAPFGRRFAAVHAELPARIVAAMSAAGVRRLIQISALKAAADAPSAYLRSKAAGEAAVLGAAATLDVTIFRLSLVVGHDDAFLNRFAALVDALPLIPLAGARTRFQPVFVGDVVDAIAAALTRAEAFGKTYELAGPRAYTLRELVEYVAQLKGRHRAVVALPEWLAFPLAALLQYLPEPPMSPDNLRMARIDYLTDGRNNPPDWAPLPLEAVAPTFLKETPQTILARRRATLD